MTKDFEDKRGIYGGRQLHNLEGLYGRPVIKCTNMKKTEEVEDYKDLEEGQEQKVEDLEWGRNQASSSSSLIHHQTPPVGRRTLLLYLSQYLGIASTRKFV